MKSKFTRNFRITYLAFCLPFILAFLSWTYFPAVAHWIVTNVFGYKTAEQAANPVWYAVTRLFYSWYTLLAIGIAGAWVIAAMIARKKHVEAKRAFYPMVSFVVPAYNQEKNISRCIASLFRCAEKYDGNCEIIVIDDGSSDYTYEVAWSTLQLSRASQPQVRGKVVRHSVNSGKIEALKTGVNKALGSIVAIIDGDSEWTPETLLKLVDYKLSNGKKAVTGYVHPSAEKTETNVYVTLQQLEYSQGLSIGRCAQSLGDNVLVVSGAIGIYDANLLREILMEKNIRSVTEDLEITLEMHKKGAKVGYVSIAQSGTVAPTSLTALWNQRLRWFTGWLYNTLGIHRDLMVKKSWLTILLWYCYVFEYVGAFIDLAAVCAFPFLLWFAPDRVLFAFNLLIFIPYGLLIGVVNQAIALKYAYGKFGYGTLLFYTPFYPILRLVNVLARSRSVLSYVMGNNGKWHLS
jgi:biofilm PGA synthesis N-glycosyltransferase PgaC